ncbi:MAG: Crp/Fnr family transcriptional regulator [Gammaproteobacteria bacterium]|nr:Crp/Fnr family transcriptional regulator [Gammaproteobacteria bacterium]MCY4218599.1 Crp/Fnr family transcriptional regulator [Gammaproteobacteria bacterium]MCY4274100.1 Crp/Fnr family transcriptional regulator [Gammaproteobacteria bacterium]
MAINEEALELSRVPLFSKLDPAKLKLIAFTSERLNLDTQEYLFFYDDPSDSVYLVLDGVLQVTVEHDDGSVDVVAELEKNQLVGEMGVIANTPRTASIRSSGSSSVLKIEADTFMTLLTENPSMSLYVMRELTSKLSKTHLQLVELKEQTEH